MNINVHVLWWTCVFIFLDKYIGVELLDHRVDALKKKKKKTYPQRDTKKLFEVIDVCYISHDCDSNLTDVCICPNSSDCVYKTCAEF